MLGAASMHAAVTQQLMPLKHLKRLRLLAVLLIALFGFLLWLTYATMERFIHASLPPTKQRDGHTGTHLMCVLIPYRDRWSELQQLIPHLSTFLRNQHVEHLFIVLNQTDSHRFNRASLINVGWFEADRLGCDYIAMHDVDILPLNTRLDYRYPGKGVVRHISAGRYHPIRRYDYANFIGGVLLMTLNDFRGVDGMSNQYWGWGLEDDEFFLRLRDAGLAQNIQRPTNLTTGRSGTFEHLHGKARKRDYAAVGNQKKMARRRDRNTGLSTLEYTIVDRSMLKFASGANASTLQISLMCNTSTTPYCDLKHPPVL